MIVRGFVQETALNHVWMVGLAGDGFGATHAMIRHNLIWVVSRMQVQVEQYPAWYTSLVSTTPPTSPPVSSTPETNNEQSKTIKILFSLTKKLELLWLENEDNY
jgi:hypothetical protein